MDGIINLTPSLLSEARHTVSQCHTVIDAKKERFTDKNKASVTHLLRNLDMAADEILRCQMLLATILRNEEIEKP